MMMVETKLVSPVQMALEQSEDQPEPKAESSLVLSTSLTSSSIDLMMVSEPTRQEITTAFIFLMGAPMKTLFLLNATMATTIATPESSIMAMS